MGYDEIEKEGRHFQNLVNKCYREATQGPLEDHELHLGEEDFHKRQQIVMEAPEALYFKYDEFEETGRSRADFTFDGISFWSRLPIIRISAV